MKACPRCHLRYPDVATTCFVDGAELVATRDPRIGTTLGGQYVIDAELAQGGMGTVYRAHHRVVKRPCAIKIMSASHARNAVVRERFRREAKAAQKLAHPNIIEILDHGETQDGLPYIAMELLEGETLAERIEAGPVTVAEAMPIAVQVARALARAHDLDVLHRDLKPENIFLCHRDEPPPLVKLLDFGIARSLHDERLTNAGDVFGTPQYMAPERITSIDAGASADLYAFGIILFELLAGQLPFQASDIPSFFTKHLREPAPSLSSRGVKVPKRLDQLVLSLMAKRPEERPVDARSTLAELVSIAEAEGIEVPTEPSQDQPRDLAPLSLAAASVDEWAARASVFERMLLTLYGTQVPQPQQKLLARIHDRIAAVQRAKEQSVEHQNKLAALEARAREGRQRFGRAVDALGLDASKAREAAREARRPLEAAKREVQAELQRFREAQQQVVEWEGRCAFTEPFVQLAAAYRQAAAQLEAWHQATQALDQLADQAVQLDNVVTDLEFQIQELRGALTRFEQSVEEERAETERQLKEASSQLDAADQELLQLATDLCRPLRGRAELAALFRQLEDGCSAG